jgi:TolA-binding protein
VCGLRLAPRFERELAPQPRDRLLDERGVEAAILRSQPSTRDGRRRGSPPWLRWAAAATVLASAVAAAAVIGRRNSSPPASPAPLARREAPAARAPIPAAETPPPEAPPPVETAPAPAAPRGRDSARVNLTAGALFERAEKLRRDGRPDAAVATYRRLQAAFPDTAEARLSFVLAGEMLLEQGRAREALAQFDRHLRIDGEVGEEALVGRATALEQLHRDGEAVAAWKSLLARYPKSVYAERARARLDERRERR